MMLIEFFLAIIVGSVVIVALMWIKSYEWRKTIDLIPGPKALPFVGNAFQLGDDSTEFYRQILRFAKEYAKVGIYRLWIGPRPVVVVFKAEYIEDLLNSSKHSEKSFFYKFFVPWLNDGLLLSAGEKWHKRRKMITPTFHFKILEEFLKVFNEQATILVSHLDKHVDCEAFDVHPYLTRCTLDIICETAMGQNVNAQDNSESDYVQAIKCFTNCLRERMKAPWLWNNTLFSLSSNARETRRCLQVLHGMTLKVIHERSAELSGQSSTDDKHNVESLGKEQGDSSWDNKKRKRLAFLDMLLDAAKTDSTITHHAIQEEVDTFMFEGHDTTASGATWAVYCLAVHPEIQLKVQQEVDRVWTDSEPLTMEMISQLMYTECFFKEVLRYYPPVFEYGRSISEDCVIGGYKVPKGTDIDFAIEPLHRNPDYFPNPDEFNPERWLDDKSSGRHPFSYLPFSAGPRNCIGQKFAMLEEKTIISYIAKNFNVSCSQKDDGKLTAGIVILRPSTGIFVHLARRA